MFTSAGNELYSGRACQAHLVTQCAHKNSSTYYMKTTQAPNHRNAQVIIVK